MAQKVGFGVLALAVLGLSWLAATQPIAAGLGAAAIIAITVFVLWRDRFVSGLLMAGLLIASGVGIRYVGEGGFSLARLSAASLALLVALFVVPKVVTGWQRQGALLLFVLWVSLSIMWSDEPRNSAVSAVSLLGALLLGTVIAVLRPWMKGSRLILAAIITALVVSVGLYIAASDLVTVLAPRPGQSPVERFVGVWPWNSDMGLVSAVAVTVALALRLETKRKRYVWAMLLSVVTLVFSESATAILACAAGVAGVLWVKRKRWRRTINVATFLTVIVALLGWLDDIEVWVLGLLGRSPDFTGRSVIWSIVLDLVSERPILGYGIGTPPDLQPFLGFQAHAHNGYLQVLLEAGVVGLAILVFALLFLLKRVALSGQGAQMGVLAVVIVSNFANNYLTTGNLCVVLLGWVALSVAPLPRKKRKRGARQGKYAHLVPGHQRIPVS